MDSNKTTAGATSNHIADDVDEVEGHGFSSGRITGDDDVEGHGISSGRITDDVEDVEGHRPIRVGDQDDDVEGHASVKIK